MAATEIVAVLDAGPLIHLKTEMLQLLRVLPAQTTLHIHKDFLAVIVARAETEAI
jgi:hypothetical protein